GARHHAELLQADDGAAGLDPALPHDRRCLAGAGAPLQLPGEHRHQPGAGHGRPAGRAPEHPRHQGQLRQRAAGRRGDPPHAEDLPGLRGVAHRVSPRPGGGGGRRDPRHRERRPRRLLRHLAPRPGRPVGRGARDRRSPGTGRERHRHPLRRGRAQGRAGAPGWLRGADAAAPADAGRRRRRGDPGDPRDGRAPVDRATRSRSPRTPRSRRPVMKMSGARIVLESLKREGVDVVFGLPGGAVLPIYDALYDFPGPLRHVLVRQEAAAGHAAEGYARVSGKVGVCLVTSGPAATNLVTALQDAYMDSMPIVAFTGQVPTHLIGNDAFQEADNVGITRPCTKHNYLVKDTRDIAPVVREAFHIAATGRPGPVHIDLPKDVLMRQAEFDYPDHVHLRSYNPTYDGHPGQVKKAARSVLRARRAVLYVGGGVIAADGAAELLELAELTRIPVTTTLMALGAFPSDHALSLGMLGMHGGYAAN